MPQPSISSLDELFEFANRAAEQATHFCESIPDEHATPGAQDSGEVLRLLIAHLRSAVGRSDLPDAVLAAWDLAWRLGAADGRAAEQNCLVPKLVTERLKRRQKVNAMASARRKLSAEQWAVVEKVVVDLRFGRREHSPMSLKDSATLVSQLLADGKIFEGVNVKVSTQTIMNRANRRKSK